MRRLLALALLPAALLAAGCGDSRTPPPDFARAADPGSFGTRQLSGVGLRFLTPVNWGYRTGEAPLVAQLASGQAQIAIWRYPRAQPLPRTLKELRLARHYLAGAARARDRTLKLQAGNIGPIDNRPSVTLLARETIAGQPRSVRSTHVYAYGAEFVVDALAPPSDFARVDRELFVPLVRSLHFSRPTG